MRPGDQSFEFRAFGPDAAAERPDVVLKTMRGESAARSFGGRMAKRTGGPVDIAYAGDEDWSERYMTTAAPSEFHAMGYGFERLDV
jgi:hypothetical protein